MPPRTAYPAIIDIDSAFCAEMAKLAPASTEMPPLSIIGSCAPSARRKTPTTS